MSLLKLQLLKQSILCISHWNQTLIPNSATDIHQQGLDNICSHITRLTTLMYFNWHSLPVVTPEWLTLRHSWMIAKNMAYYCLPLWNPVLRKVVLSQPRRHNEGTGVQLHSFLTLAIKWRSVVNSMPWPLYPQGRIPCTLWVRGWVVPQPVWTFQRREKSHVSTGVQNPCLPACSIITIAHSFTQNAQWTKTSNQHILQSPVCIMYCT